MDFVPERQPLHLPPDPAPRGRIGHLMFPDDLAPPPDRLGKISATAAFIPPVLETTPLVSAFLNGAVNDTLHRTHGSRLAGPFPSAVSDWISAEKLDSIVVSQPNVGFTKDFLDAEQLPVPPHFFIRDWDRKLWPHATAGFFKLKAALPKIHAALAPRRKDDLFPDF